MSAAVIHEVDEALRALVRAEVLAGAEVDLVFDAPTRDWAARRNTPTVNLYLYDIREDLKRGSRGRQNVYDADGAVVARTLPPRYFKLSYLISAWTQRPEDEHRLLAALLHCFLRHTALPPPGLGPELAATGLPVPIGIALPPPEDRAFADVWSALGGELKPSLDLVVSAPVVTAPLYPAGPPVGEDGLHLQSGEFGGPPAREVAEEEGAADGGRPVDGPLTDGPPLGGVAADGPSADGRGRRRGRRL
ncbi:DUF4255 domain-containing protein [Kitasatospora sp. NPDC001664]